MLERAGSFFDETRGRASAAAFESRPAAPDGVAFFWLGLIADWEAAPPAEPEVGAR